MEYEEKFIGLVDVLGSTKMLEAVANASNQPLSELIELINTFGVLGLKKMSESAVDGSGQPLSELIESLNILGSPEDALRFKKSGPSICPESKFLQRDLNFRIRQVSDYVLVSAEVSPAGVINLISYCSTVVLSLLLQRGIMCRGSITKGLIYHTDTEVSGPGWEEVRSKEQNVTAFKREAEERGTPFVEVDSIVCAYIRECGDRCVKMMFSRMVKVVGEGAALFPFQRFSHSLIFGGWPGHKFDPEKERRLNEDMRGLIKTLKERLMSLVDKSNSRAVIKAEHYIEALNDQLTVCDSTDEAIDTWSR